VRGVREHLKSTLDVRQSCSHNERLRAGATNNRLQRTCANTHARAREQCLARTHQCRLGALGPPRPQQLHEEEQGEDEGDEGHETPPSQRRCRLPAQNSAPHGFTKPLSSRAPASSRLAGLSARTLDALGPHSATPPPHLKTERQEVVNFEQQPDHRERDQRSL